MIDRIYFESPIGFVLIEANERGVFAITFCDLKPRAPKTSRNLNLRLARKELRAYFAGEQASFSFRLDLKGTSFQKSVWRALRKIHFGRTASYSLVARLIKRPKAIRAVGGANHRNALLIVIPCHRIVGKSGRLVGYAAGLRRKAWLLKHERIFSGRLTAMS